MSKKSSRRLTGGLARRRLEIRLTECERRRAGRLAYGYAGCDLPAVLAAFAADLAVAAERPGSWEYERVTAWLASHPWPRRASEDQPCP